MERTDYINIIFPNGEKWRVNAYPIAKEAAEFNVKVSKIDPDFDPEQYDIEINDNLDYYLSEDGFDDLLDYMENFSDWDKLDKKQVKTEGFPDHAGWLLSGNFVAKAGVNK